MTVTGGTPFPSFPAMKVTVSVTSPTPLEGVVTVTDAHDPVPGDVW